MKNFFFELNIWKFNKLLHTERCQFEGTNFNLAINKATHYELGMFHGFRLCGKGATGSSIKEVGEFPPSIEHFVDSYLATASFVTCDSDENQNFTKNSIAIAKEHCLNFIDAVRNEFDVDKGNELLTIGGNDLTYLAPHDFFLTRNGHGAGFWDREDVYGKNEAAKLTKIAIAMGEVDCYHVNGKKSKLTF